jgi:signal peptidase II
MKKVWIFAGVLFLIDQVTKLLFTDKNYIFTDWFKFSYVKNYGATFGILQGQRWVFVIIAIILIILIIKLKDSFSNKYVISLLLAGAFGNLVDRIIFGYVRDFISIGFWPTFNIADSVTVIGVILILIQILKEEKVIKS